MGLLDDAIREHLELKRRRGVDPSEVAREETEALGPARREAAEEPAKPEPLEDDVAPSALDEPAEAYDDVEPESAPEPEPELRFDEPPVTHDEPYPQPEEESATPPHGDPLLHQPTREFSATELGDALGREEPPAAVDEPEPEAADPKADDELEDTPDFLQETPEHDRLWFEQKPPKDFDF